LVNVLSTANSRIGIFEEQGNAIFVPLRPSGTLTQSRTVGQTDANGNITFVLAPTDYPQITNYSIYVALLDNNDNIVQQENLTILDSTQVPTEKKTISNQFISDDTKIAVNAMNAIISSLFIWANGPPNPQANMFNLTVYDNGSYVISSTTSNDQIQTGAVNVFNITLRNSTDNSILAGYIEPKENIGHLLMNPIYNSSSVGYKAHNIFSRYIPTGQEFVLTPSSYPPVSAQVQLLIYDSALNQITAVNLTTDIQLEPRSGVYYEDDNLKQAINYINPIIKSLYYALN